MDREQKEQEITQVMGYRSGESLINTVYVGGIASAAAIRILGGSYGESSVKDLLPAASDKQVDEVHKYLGTYINHMKKNPVTHCSQCGQIIPA